VRGVPERLCGRTFGEAGLAAVRETVLASCGCSRAEIARRVCDRLRWFNERGLRKEVGARVALLALERGGWIELPVARNGNGSGQPPHVAQGVPPPQEIVGSVEQLEGVRLERVSDAQHSALWNVLIERYHYLHGWRLSGEQVRYLIVCEAGVLGAVGYGAAALKLAVRDRWIGWDARQRETMRSAVVNNRRLLILPWVRVRNLASRVLSLGGRAVVRDYARLYSRRAVLLETFVESGRFTGASYRAANWQYLGESTGRGRNDRHHQAARAAKAVYVYPLERHFRRTLLGCGR